MKRKKNNTETQDVIYGEGTYPQVAGLSNPMPCRLLYL